MKIYFSWKITIVSGILALLMVRASVWQYERYIAKQDYIARMEERLAVPPVPLDDLLAEGPIDPEALAYRRVLVEGEFDFEHEVVLRNRRFGEHSGVFVLTPLKLRDSHKVLTQGYGASELIPPPPPHVLVSRGFIPLIHAEQKLRSQYRGEPKRTFLGLVKLSMERRMFAPRDPPSGADRPWVDKWLRVDVEGIGRQMPYPLLPIYLELMSEIESSDLENPQQDTDNEARVTKERILSSKAGREELFFLGESTPLSGVSEIPEGRFPVPIYDTVIPPGRHFGYIFEWLFIAFLTVLTGALLQLRPPRSRPRTANE